MALFSSSTCLIAGSFKGTTHPKIAKLLTDHGATITKQVGDPALTHLIASEAEYVRGTKTTAILERRKAGETIHILPLSWVEDSIDQGQKLAEKDYDYEANAEQEEDGAEEDAAPEDEEDAKPAKGKGKEKTSSSKSNDQGKKRARSPTPTPPPAPAPAPKMVKVQQKGTCPVDHLFPYKDSTHVFFAADGVPYDAMLNQTDLSKNANKYFILQVLQHDKLPNTFYTFFRWGRVGENGQQSTKECTSASQAVELFEKKFQDKTTHPWSSRTSSPKAGKYTYLERHYGSDDSNGSPSSDEDVLSPTGAGPSTSTKKPKKEADTLPPISSLPTETQSLMSMIFSLSSLSSTLTSFEYDARKLPLGKLAKSTLEAGYTALREIADLLNDTTGTMSRDRHGLGRAEALMMLSNRYYTTVPHAFGRNRPPVIRDKVKLKHELDLVDALGDLKITQELINSAKLNATAGLHPLDAQYQSLGIQKLDPISTSSSTFQTLQSLLSRTKGSTHYHTLHLISAFSVSREDDDKKFEAFNRSLPGGGTRRLLWHGSRSSNFGGILSEGCKLAPPSAPLSGWMFGKGFYLASMSTKSAQYCYHQISNNEGLLMLVEAQLGPKPFYVRQQAEYEADQSAKKAGFLSTWGVGRTQPAGWQDAGILDPSLKGVQMPTIEKDPVEANTTSALLYDEFIVYNTAQVRIRYLLRVRFDAEQDDYY